MTTITTVALITGITGQDGSYLAEYLLGLNYKVHGIIRRASTFNTKRIDHIFNNPNMVLHYGDITDMDSVLGVLAGIKTNLLEGQRLEVYNLAAQSHVAVSFQMPIYTSNTDAIGTLNMLEAIRVLELIPVTRFYQASTSELYGKVQEVPQRETTPFYPRSPYAVAKVYSYWMVRNYREAYGMHASNGILFNHTSPRRGETFVDRKITLAVAAINKGVQECVYLGNINSKRDWGHAVDYVKAMHLMLQQDGPDDFVISSEEYHSVREFVEKAFGAGGMKIGWKGEGLDEVGYVEETGKVVVRIDKRYFRPTEVDELLGDSSYAREKLGWVRTYSFDQIVTEMVEYDGKAVHGDHQ